ncbi:MAG: SEC-C metal-binding domain-containing protein, partial [Armatimonadota bacterium]|nr:SEC-C metal-binding domain-containing protein [Armatimonadota bacterium]
MTGTAKTEEEEFRKIYGLDVVVIPTHKPMIRVDYPDVIYKTEEAKFRGITAEILRLYCRQQPVLVGTRSIEKSEILSSRLSPERLQLLAATMVLKSKLNEARDMDAEKKREFTALLNKKFGELTIGRLLPVARALGISLDMLAPENVERVAPLIGVQDAEEVERLRKALAEGIPHNVLNAKYHEREAQIIAEAGRLGAVTIATNMAGRGVDIILGGKPEGSTANRNPEADKVVSLGGLAIIGSERHESRRIDNQLRGRSGRQGDPGCSRFYCSLEDELWRVFGDKSKSVLLNSWQEDEPIDWKPLSKMIELTQKRMESYHFSIRKHVLQYDDVMNVQREVIYSQRRKILEGVNLKPTIIEYLHTTIRNAINMYCPEGVHPSEWDTDTLFEMMDEIFPLSVYARPSDLKGKKRDELEEFLNAVADRTYEDREQALGVEVMRDLERQIALRAINNKWIDHLDAMDYLEEGIGMRGYAGIDPVIAFKKEAYEMFQQMLESIQDEILRMVFRVQVKVVQEPYRNPFRNITMYGGEYVPTMDVADERDNGRSPVQVTVQRKHKVGRNDPCPCGSGKKYKKCCLGKEG